MGAHLKELRELLGIESQSEFAKILGIEPNLYSHHERQNDKKLTSIWRALLLKVATEHNIEVREAGDVNLEISTATPRGSSITIDDDNLVSTMSGRPQTTQKLTAGGGKRNLNLAVSAERFQEIEEVLATWVLNIRGVDNAYVIDAREGQIAFADSEMRSTKQLFDGQEKRYARRSLLRETFKADPADLEGQPQVIAYESARAHHMFVRVDDDGFVILCARTSIKGRHDNYQYTAVKSELLELSAKLLPLLA